jgi:hypothetical protein
MSKSQAKKSEPAEMEKKAAAGEEVIPGGKGGLSVEAQKNLAEGSAPISDSSDLFGIDLHWLRTLEKCFD